MARPIAPTPTLEGKSSRRFREKVEADLQKPLGPVPTPKLDEAVKKIMADAREAEK